MKHKNLVLIGTSHIARQSLKEVEDIIEKEEPDIIALELDAKRAYSLMHPKKVKKPRMRDIGKIGIKGYLFSLIGAWAEKKLGQKVGVKPGAEMVKALKIAKKKKIIAALIDQDIEITLRNISKTLSWREKWNFIVDVFKAIVLRKQEIKFDLATVPSAKIIKKLTKKVRKRYPNIYKVIVTDRNKIMAKNLSKLMKLNAKKKIVAIIGAGHEKELLDLIKKYLNKQTKDIVYEQNILGHS